MSGHRCGVDVVEACDVAQEGVGEERQAAGQGNAGGDRGRERQGQALVGDLGAAPEADRDQQIEREKACDRLGHRQVGAAERCRQTHAEEQHRGREEILSSQCQHGTSIACFDERRSG